MFKFAILLSLLAVSFGYKSYEGYQTWRIEKDAGNFVTHFVHTKDVDIFSESPEYVDILVEPREIRHLQSYFSRNSIKYDVVVENVEEIVKSQRKIAPAAYTPLEYNTLEDIYARMDEIAAASDTVSVGTFENPTLLGNEQKYIVFEGGENIIWVDCTTHAREWITTAVCSYGIDLFAARSDPRVDTLLETSTVYIMPVVNPDGYAYSWTDDRLWRKNLNQNSDGSCLGVDLNRNFDDGYWGTVGVSHNECSTTYCGSSAASEIETQNSQNFFQQLAATGNLKVFYSIHSYSQMWLYPYGFTEDAAPDAGVLDLCAEIGRDALAAVYDTVWVYGPISTTIYPVSGSTVDYAYAQAGVTHSYTLELRDRGIYGFVIPEDQIEPSGIETWEGLFAAFQCALDNPGRK